MSTPSLSGEWGVVVTDHDDHERADYAVLRVFAFLTAAASELPQLLQEVAAVYASPYSERQQTYGCWYYYPPTCWYDRVRPVSWAWSEAGARLDGRLVFAPAREAGCVHVSAGVGGPFGPKDLVAVADLLSPDWLADYVFYNKLRSIL